MKATLENQLKMKEVMADLRKEGARCCLIYTQGESEVYNLRDRDVNIRAVLKDGRIWDIHEIKSYCGKNEAIVTCATE